MFCVTVNFVWPPYCEVKRGSLFSAPGHLVWYQRPDFWPPGVLLARFLATLVYQWPVFWPPCRSNGQFSGFSGALLASVLFDPGQVAGHPGVHSRHLQVGFIKDSFQQTLLPFLLQCSHARLLSTKQHTVVQSIGQQGDGGRGGALPDMQFVTNFTRILFQNNLFTRETRKLRHAMFSDKAA